MPKSHHPFWTMNRAYLHFLILSTNLHGAMVHGMVQWSKKTLPSVGRIAKIRPSVAVNQSTRVIKMTFSVIKSETARAAAAKSFASRAPTFKLRTYHSTTTMAHVDGRGSVVWIYPRRKAGAPGGAPERGRRPMQLTHEAVAALFSTPQGEAAQALGISLTAL